MTPQWFLFFIFYQQSAHNHIIEKQKKKMKKYSCCKRQQIIYEELSECDVTDGVTFVLGYLMFVTRWWQKIFVFYDSYLYWLNIELFFLPVLLQIITIGQFGFILIKWRSFASSVCVCLLSICMTIMLLYSLNIDEFVTEYKCLLRSKSNVLSFFHFYF